MRFAVVDIETTLGNSHEGFIKLARVKPLYGGSAKLISLKTHGADKVDKKIDIAVVAAIRDEMNKYDGWVTWNGLGFDLPYIDDRLIVHGLHRLERKFARGLDAMWHAKMFKSMFLGASLENVSIGLGYTGTVRLPLNQSTFVRSKLEALERFKSGSEHFDRVERHNRGCIRLTEFCYEKLKPRIQNISRWG